MKKKLVDSIEFYDKCIIMQRCPLYRVSLRFINMINAIYQQHNNHTADDENGTYSAAQYNGR